MYYKNQQIDIINNEVSYFDEKQGKIILSEEFKSTIDGFEIDFKMQESAKF